MPKLSILYLKLVLIALALGVLTVTIYFPPSEGRAAGLDLVSIYFRDPLLWYLYFTTIPLYLGLYQAFRLLTYTNHNQILTRGAIKSFRYIRYASLALGTLYAGLMPLVLRMADEADAPGAIVLWGGVIVAVYSISALSNILETFVQPRIKS